VVSVREGEVLERLRVRDRAACEAFVDTHYAGVYRFFTWLSNNADTAADLTQETFAHSWASAETLEAARVPDLKAWLYGIARNRWRKRCRDSQAGWAGNTDLEAAEELPDPTPGPEALALRAFEAAAVVRAVADLPLDYREALVLRVFEELTYGQIGEALGITEGLARWRVHRARHWLHRALGAQGAEEGAGAASA